MTAPDDVGISGGGPDIDADTDADDTDTDIDTDAAPVSQLPYQGRSTWQPGRCVGFVINNAGITAARLRWPKGQNRRGIFARIKKTQNSEKRRSMRRQKNRAIPRTIG
jgi:hypothetical protein